MCCLFHMDLKGLFSTFNPSKFLIYASLLFFAIFLGLRLDGFLLWSYYTVFIPLWIWKAVVLFGAAIGLLIWLKHPEYRHESTVDIQAMLISASLHLLLLLFEILLCTNMEYHAIAYRIVFIPLFCISTFALAGCVWGFRHERQLEFETFFAVNTLQFVCISLKWDEVVSWTWLVVLVPVWIILCLLFICVLYYIIWALLFMRSPEIAPQQRKTHVFNAIVTWFMVVPLIIFMVMLSRKLDGVNNFCFSVIFIPLHIALINLLVSSFYQKSGNLWWFGMRQDFCEVLLSRLPLLREYGNVSYKFSDAIVDTNHSDNFNIEEIESYSKKRVTPKIVGSLTAIDTPD
ncbi:transmembrane protein 185A isoform X2 [Hydra vulgaris]|uniref:Transmembrane protein 185A isoform X2 n=1 Tax=Hydra vulgaris TaxID=6087 RepID=A0ABM4D4I0_HYDVU